MVQTIETISDPTAMRRFSDEQKRAGRRIAFVPTMGALHAGHASLIERARTSADCVVTSIFVNPTQFGPNEDFEQYPRTLEADLLRAGQAGCDIVFTPSTADMYPDGVNCNVNVKGAIVETFEGESRPGHFNGVATIVAKLFNIVSPDSAVFGLKDYQQTLVIRALTRDLNFPISIDLAPTSRESNGLARSSRNVYLSEAEREKAAVLYRALCQATASLAEGERRRHVLDQLLADTLGQVPEISIDYARAVDAQNLSSPEQFGAGSDVVFLLALRLGCVRLFDNMLASVPAV